MDWKPLLIIVLVGLSWVVFLYHVRKGTKGTVWIAGMFTFLGGSTGFVVLGTFVSVEQSLDLWMQLLCGVIMTVGGIVMWMGNPD